MNLGTADQPGSPLSIIPEDLLLQIITEIRNFATRIGENTTYTVPVYRLRYIKSIDDLYIDRSKSVDVICRI